MNEKKMQHWGKWHKRGYKTFMLANLGMVCAFYAFSGTIAYVQLFMTMPESVKARGGGVPVWPVFLIIFILVPLAAVFCHFGWKSKEKQYAEYQRINAEKETEVV